MDWYVLQTKTGAERDTQAKLQRAGLDARVPAELRPIHRCGAWTQQEYVLLPGYVFVGMDFSAEHYQRIRTALGAARLLGMHGEAPTPIAAREAALLGLCEPEAPLVPSVIVFDAHGTPRVVSGPLRGREATILHIDSHARRATVAARLPDGGIKTVRFGVTIARGAQRGSGP